jgi:hypothetical protein
MYKVGPEKTPNIRYFISMAYMTQSKSMVNEQTGFFNSRMRPSEFAPRQPIRSQNHGALFAEARNFVAIGLSLGMEMTKGRAK